MPTYPPNSWPFPSPNPPVGDLDQDQTPRWGEGTPLPVKMADYYPGKPSGKSQTLTVSSTAVFLNRDAFANSAIVQVQGYPIRWIVDGDAPTASTGFRADPGDQLRIGGPESLTGFQAIREGTQDATLIVQFYT